jgi:glycosyltransferase involved in cell wall biosynthesis/SAM-dependent methyltransferase
MSQPLVSITCLSYNHEKYIAQAIESFLMQKTSFSFEIIIHDDASTDDSQRIIKEYEKKYPEIIKTICQTDNQYSKGIKPWAKYVVPICQGQYIAFCEGDDYWTDPYKLQKQVDFLQSHEDYSECYHNTLIEYEEPGRKSHLACPPNQPEIYSIEDLLNQNLIQTSSIVFRVENLPAYLTVLSPGLLGDWLLHIVNSFYGKIGYINETMSVYRKHSNGVWSSLTEEEKIKTKIKFYENLEKIFPERLSKIIQPILKEYQNKNITISSDNGTNSVPNEFINLTINKESMDKYVVRKSILDFVRENLRALAGTVLDLGCGEMPYRNYILNNSRVNKYVGLDIENPLYQQSVKPDLFWDGRKIPLEDNSVDNVLATEFFEHVPNPELIMKEIYRVLKPGGSLFLTVPFIWSLHTIPNDEYRYTPFSLERHLKNSGFCEVKVKALGGWNASLAQVIGLWTLRKPMGKEEREKFAEMFFPLYKQLVETDTIPDKFEEGFLPTGFSCVASKVKIEKESYIDEFDSNDNVNLAIFTPNFGTLSETFIQKHIKHLAPGRTVVVTGNIYDPKWADVPVLQIPYKEGPAKYSPEVAAKVENFLKSNNVTHILAEYGCYGTEIVEFNNRKLGLPIFIHFHGADAAAMLRKKETVDYYKWMGEHVTGVITVSEPMAARLINISIPEEKLFINHYGIDIPDNVITKPEKEPCRFIFVGRLTPKKAPLLLIKAFEIAIKKVPSIKLEIVGDHFLKEKTTDIKTQLENYIRVNNLTSSVTLHGAQDNNYIKDILQECSVYVQHSITVPETGDAEGLPNSILEAAAYGLPVISTFHEGIPEEVENDITGFLVDEFDIDKMAEYMIKLAGDPILRKQMGLAGREKIKEQFSTQLSIEGLSSIIFSNNQMNIPEMINSVKDLISKGDFEVAKDLCYEILTEDLKNTEAYYLLGEIYYSQKNYELAIRNYTTVFESSKDNTDTASKIILSYIQLNRRSDAEKFLKKIVIENPYDQNLKVLCKELRVALSWEDVKTYPVLKLYAGDIPDSEEYKNLIGLSIEKNDYRHIRHDITSPLPLNDNAVESFQAEDVMEHIDYSKLPAVINEIHRVLKPGGYFRLSVPDYGTDVYINRSIKDNNGNIIFDPGGGGTQENPGHLWYPRFDNVTALLAQTNFKTDGEIKFLHYYKMDGTPVTNTIDYSKGFVHRTPDFDQRVQTPYRPMSMVVDLIKSNSSSQINNRKNGNKSNGTSGHYDEKYFEYQNKIGEFGGRANLFKFEEFIEPDYTVIDFGCGGGYLLKNIMCSDKIGIEVNPAAAKAAEKSGIKVYTDAEQLQDGIADIIISNHALEHVPNPYDTLVKLRCKLKQGGKIVFVVPHEDTRNQYNPADVNKHLYTWNQMTLGNLFSAAGYKIIKSEAIQHQWPPNYEEVYSKYGEAQFHNICRENAVRNNNYQIRVVAER